MQQFTVLMRARFRMLSASLLDRRKNALVRNLSSAIVLAILMYAAYLFFHDLIFSYVISLERIGFLLIERLISVAFLVFFIMLVISGFIMTAATVVKSDEAEYLFSMPAPHRRLFMSKFLDILVYGSWAIVAMATPIMLSYARARDFGVLEYILSGVLVTLPFVVSASAIGAIAAFCILRLRKKWSAPKVTAAASLVITLLIFTAIRFSRPNDLVIPFTEDFRALNIFINNFRLNSHPFSPNFWLIQSLRSLAMHSYGSFLLYASAIASTAFLSISILYYLADRWYLMVWSISLERPVTDRRKISNDNTVWNRLLNNASFSREFALLQRDIRIFLRQRGQWSQLALMLALISLYFYNLRYIPMDTDIQWTIIIASINFGFCGFILATLAIRFVFPSISMEGDAYWILATSPVAPSTIFREKFWSAFAPFLVLTELIAWISGSILTLDPFLLVMTISGVFLMSIALVAISTGFGASLPEFDEPDPSKIASGMGGLLAIAASLVYIALLTLCFGWAGRLYVRYEYLGQPFSLSGIAAITLAAVFLTAIAVIVPLRMGVHAMKVREL